MADKKPEPKKDPPPKPKDPPPKDETSIMYRDGKPDTVKRG